jgi:4'-phosphopantetheinyl transferase
VTSAPQRQTSDAVGEPDPIELWLVDCSRLAEPLSHIEKQARVLPPGELERAARIVDPEDAARWRTGRIALRVLLAARANAQAARSSFRIESGGRPVLVNADLDFSISDTGSQLVIALSRAGRVGVDIEAERELKMAPHRIARLIVASNGLVGPEGTQLDERAATQGWTRIEAYAKATAPSLAACLSSLGTAGHRGHPITHDELREGAQRLRIAAGVAVYDLSLPDQLAGAVALPIALGSNTPKVRLLDEAALGAFADCIDHLPQGQQPS